MEKELRRALLDAPDMFTFRDQEAMICFQNVRRLNPESPFLYFAINWARLMEKELNEKGTLDKETIRQCGKLANIVGNSGFTYRWALSVLIVYWRYGYEYLADTEYKEEVKEDELEKLYLTDKVLIEELQKEGK